MSARLLRLGGVRGALRGAAWSAIIFLAAAHAGAEGRTFNPGGTKALARGGAVVARPDDALALHHNPAGLAFLEGTQLYVGADVPFYSACVEPIGYYGWGIGQPGISEFGNTDEVQVDDPDPQQRNPLPGQYSSTPLHEVCNSSPNAPIPQLAVAMRLGPRWAVGFGFVGPSLIAGQQWGGADATISRDGRTWPTPTRYQLVQEEFTFAYNPTVGIAYRVLPRLSVGLNVQWLGLGVTNTVVQPTQPGTSPDKDALARVEAADYFIPAATVSLHAKPLRRIDAAIAFHWFDSFDGSGQATFTTNYYRQGIQGVGGVPYENPPIELESVHTPLPWQLVAGARYAEPLAAPPGTRDRGSPKDDSLATELFDVELDVALTFNAHASETTVRAKDTCERDPDGTRKDPIAGTAHSPGCQTLSYRERQLVGTELQTGFQLRDVPPDGYTLDRHWENQVALRLGGSYTVLPNRLQIHAGAYYETRGIDPAFASIDVMLSRRIGLGVGAVVRMGHFDLMAAYGHIFQETLKVGAPPHSDTGFDKRLCGPNTNSATCLATKPLEETNAPNDPDATAALQQSSLISPEDARIINAGIYRASFNIISIGVAYHF
jgi:long-subunit fatty acid transport protein